MLKSPSRKTSRERLLSLLENDGFSPSGQEYDLAEVRDLLFERETRHAEKEFKRQLLDYAQAHSRAESVTEQQAQVVRDFQDSILRQVSRPFYGSQRLMQ